MKVGIIGIGYWGPNLVRNFFNLDEVNGIVCSDLSATRLKFIESRFPTVETTADYREVIKRTDVDMIAVATPVSSHFELGMAALKEGKHLLIEKPMSGSVREAEELIECSKKNELTLMVDHTFVYTGAVRKIKEIIVNQLLGEIYYFDSVRVNLGLFQHDVNVIWDLAPHDLSIMSYVLTQKPIAVSAVGVRHVDRVEDVAYLTVFFENNLIAHFHVNWLAPVKVRTILIGGSKRMVMYDDLEASDKVKVYDKGIEANNREGIYETLIQYRTGDMFAPKVDQTEPLSLMCKHFVDCVTHGIRPLTDGRAGLDVVKVLEASGKSLQQGGKVIKLD
jgi:predicted dehydrogenase